MNLARTAAAPAAGRGATRRGALWTAGGVVAIAGAFSILSLSGSTITSLVREDGVVEWIGAIGLFAAAGFFLAAFIVARRRGPASGKSRAGTWVLLLFAATMLMLGGEEISWGQRLLGLSTPEAISSVNAQDETTLHNLQPFQGTALDGDRLFRAAWLGIFVLLPVVAWLVPRWGKRLRTLLPVAPLGLAVLFVSAWLLTRVAVGVFDDDWTSVYAVGSAATEVQEMVVEVLMGVTAFVVWRGVAGRAGTDG